jgi:hypothetical protein
MLEAHPLGISLERQIPNRLVLPAAALCAALSVAAGARFEDLRVRRLGCGADPCGEVDRDRSSERRAETWTARPVKRPSRQRLPFGPAIVLRLVGLAM